MTSIRAFTFRTNTDDDDTPFFVSPPQHVADYSEMITSNAPDAYVTHPDGILPTFVTDGHGNMLFGAGNPATGYDTQEAGGLLVFSKAILRQGADLPQIETDSHGVVYQAPSGGQPGNPSYAAWNWNFGVAATGNHTLADFDVHMRVTLDPSHAQDSGFKTDYPFLDLDLIKPANDPSPGGSNYVWALHSDHSVIVIGDDGGVANKVSENSENIKFFQALLNADNRHANPGYDGSHEFQVEIIGTAHNSPNVIVDHTMSIFVG